MNERCAAAGSVGYRAELPHATASSNSRSGRPCRTCGGLAWGKTFQFGVDFCCIENFFPYSACCKLAPDVRPAELEDCRWRTRQKIEHLIPPSPISCPGSYFHKKKCKADTVAAGGCDILYGVWRNLWNRRHRSRGGLRPGNFAAAGDAADLEFADDVHDRRTLQRAAVRGRILRVGAAGDGKFLGISGSVAVAGGEYFRYGDLSDAFCGVLDAADSVVCPGPSRVDGGDGRGDGVRADEYRRDTRGGDQFAVAVLFVVRAVCADRADCAGENWSVAGRGDRADHFERGIDRRVAHLHVELHGVGQRFDDCDAGEAAAENLSAGDDCGGDCGFADVCAAVCGDVADGSSGGGV